jgi:ceramide glucosyltransferase
VPLLLLRLAVAVVAGRLVLEDRRVLRDLWLVPLRDLAGIAIWAAGLFGSTVVWRGTRLRLRRDGRIAPVE